MKWNPGCLCSCVLLFGPCVYLECPCCLNSAGPAVWWIVNLWLGLAVHSQLESHFSSSFYHLVRRQAVIPITVYFLFCFFPALCEKMFDEDLSSSVFAPPHTPTPNMTYCIATFCIETLSLIRAACSHPSSNETSCWRLIISVLTDALWQLCDITCWTSRSGVVHGLSD